MADPRDETLAVVLAGGSGSRLDVLTDRRAKPAMRFAGTYRLIDFPLSNCRNSHLPDVWVVEQYEPHSLVDHLGNGRPWDLDRTHGGLRILHPHTGTEGEGFHRGTADALAKIRPFLREHGASRLLVLSSDHVYRLDYREVLGGHVEAAADLTIVTTEVDRGEATRFGVVERDGDRVTGFVRKPDEPPSRTVSTEVFVFEVEPLLAAMDELDADLEEADDVGDALIPHLVETGRVRAHPLGGYWRDVGTIASYFEGHLDLLGPDPALDLADRDWPILSQRPELPAGYVAAGARVEDSFVSPGAVVRGTVRCAVIGPGAVVEAGATVERAVILDDAHLGRGAHVEVAVVDEAARVGEGARVGGDVDIADSEAITLVGRDADVGAGVEVPPGSRVPPGRR